MQFLLKVQNISGAEDEQDTGSLVLTHEFTPADENAAQKKGRLFSVVDLSTDSSQIDLKSLASLFFDSVQESYFRPSDDTPLHSIEKALNRAVKLVASQIAPGMQIRFSFATALVWNSVLYASYLGSPAVYLIRGTGTRNLNTNGKNEEIWTSSNILADGDLMVLGTETFAREFPSNEIGNSLGNISHTIANSYYKQKIAAVLIKTEIKKDITNVGLRERLPDIDLFAKVKGKIAGGQALSDKFKRYQSKKTAPVASIGGNPQNTSGSSSISVNDPKPTRLTRSKNQSKRGKMIAGIVMLMGLGFAGHWIIFQTKTDSINPRDINSEIANIDGSIKGITKEAPKSEKLHEHFIDLNKIESSLKAVDIGSTKDYIIVLSKGSLYRIHPVTKEAKKVYDNLNQAKLLNCSNDFCYIYDSGTLHVVKPGDSEINKGDRYTTDQSDIIAIYPYGNKVYLMSTDQIYSITLIQTESQPKTTLWLKDDQELSNASSLAIDGSVFVLSGRDIVEFFDGREQPYSADTKDLLSPIRLELYRNSLYVLDSISDGEKRIVVFDRNTGRKIKETKLAQKTDTESLPFFTITKDGNQDIIYEHGGSLYKVKE